MRNSRELRSDLALLLLRLVLGATMLFVGSQKMLGILGGMGYTPTFKLFTEQLGIPAPLAHLAIIAEFFGGIALLVGALTPLAGFGVFCTMVGATFFATERGALIGPILRGEKGAASEKLAFPLVLAFVALALVLLGGGRFSVDALIFGKKPTKGKAK